VFKSEKKPGEEYSLRVKMKNDRVLDPDQWLDVKEYAAKLDLTRSRGEYWRLAFQGNLHKISEADYETISSDVDAAAKATATR
jgi:hypothetical protein